MGIFSIGNANDIKAYLIILPFLIVLTYDGMIITHLPFNIDF